MSRTRGRLVRICWYIITSKIGSKKRRAVLKSTPWKAQRHKYNYLVTLENTRHRHRIARGTSSSWKKQERGGGEKTNVAGRYPASKTSGRPSKNLTCADNARVGTTPDKGGGELRPLRNLRPKPFDLATTQRDVRRLSSTSRLCGA
jgi:hypothetical protein